MVFRIEPFPLPLEGGGRVGVRGCLNKNLTSFARALRSNQTEAEKLLWKRLRGKQVRGFKFRRQQQIGNYIVDFMCSPLNLVIELDGSQHIESCTDGVREHWLNEQGYHVLRFYNTDVLKNLEGVLTIIDTHCMSHPPLTPPIEGGETKTALIHSISDQNKLEKTCGTTPSD
ncbi:MAG: endonuclease domain-containing protein [Spirochaetes bacterium]|nr:MAG: endonuclease domain-containing protein [Spirochaetota bacterium]